MHDKEKKPALVIFAKAPEPGQVKTRLLPYLTPQEVTELHRAFVLDTIARLKPIGAVQRYIACYPSSTHPFFSRLGKQYQLELLDQQGSDLGERMSTIVRGLAARHMTGIVLISTDSPTLPVSYLNEAFHVLQKKAVVLGPSKDGGYYLIGISRWIPQLFEGIPWSTENVFKTTLQQIHHLKLAYEILPQWFDVDHIEDLKILANQLAKDPHLAPQTWTLIESYQKRSTMSKSADFEM